jgi:hypothetical protein
MRITLPICTANNPNKRLPVIQVAFCLVLNKNSRRLVSKEAILIVVFPY